ncbi:hypothetical protein MMC32_006772 [Xylographa parallela]|nr:hypothetical protein [Xylographa parallela]
MPNFQLIKDCVIFVEHSKRKTVTVSDVIFALKRASIRTSRRASRGPRLGLSAARIHLTFTDSSISSSLQSAQHIMIPSLFFERKEFGWVRRDYGDKSTKSSWAVGLVNAHSTYPALHIAKSATVIFILLNRYHLIPRI